MIFQVLHHRLQIQDHLTLHAVAQKKLRQLAIIYHMWKIALFVIKRNAEGIVKNYAPETRRAKQFLSAIKFNKVEVFTRCILCKTLGDIFAADVMYHKNSMTNYIVKFQRHVTKILHDNDDHCDNSIKRELFLEMVATLELDKEVTQHLIVETH